MKETDITPQFHTRWCFLLLIFLAVGGTVFAYLCGDIVALDADAGFVFPSSDTWISDKFISLCAGVALSVLSALFLGYLNKAFNIIRHVTRLFAGLFIFFQGACPSVMGQLYDGTLMCALLLLSMVPMFDSFQNPKDTRRVFLTFCLISFGSLCDVSCVAYLAVFLIGCIQMQCMKFKAFLAMLLGIITPYWIVFGAGLARISNLQMPEFVSIFHTVPKGDALILLVYAGLTMFLGIVAGVLNLVKVYSYNARTRAYNGFFMVLFLCSCLLALVDYRRFTVYLPIINLTSAFQIGHFFVINNQKRAYIPLLVIVVAYVAIYWWTIFM
ncbi:MAG: hypothetical protein NC127_05370 [Muribaculum sp.]|nr:hypothetical protein [Muribaculum sp.]